MQVASPNTIAFSRVVLTASNGHKPSNCTVPGLLRHSPCFQIFSLREELEYSCVLWLICVFVECMSDDTDNCGCSNLTVKAEFDQNLFEHLVAGHSVSIQRIEHGVDNCTWCYRSTCKLIKFPTVFFYLPLCWVQRLK